MSSVNNTNVKYINETWLSNQLAWLLDPNGSHGLGSEFAQKLFLDILRKEDMGNFDKFNNFKTIREFFLNKKKSNGRLIDLVYMDLEEKKVFVIENKFLGHNSKNQLIDNFEMENLFYGCKIIYIYLTFDERIENERYNENNLPEEIQEKEFVKEKYHYLSWSSNIYNILKDEEFLNYELYTLVSLIDRLKNRKDFLTEDIVDENEIYKFIENILTELTELNATSKKVSWKRKEEHNYIQQGNYKKEKISLNIGDQLIEMTDYDNKCNIKIRRTIGKQQTLLNLVYACNQIYASMKGISIENLKQIKDNELKRII